MTIASSNFTTLRFGEYADPATSVWPTTIKEIPMTGESMSYQTTSIQSQNINSSRQILDTIKTGYDVSGGLQFELAPGIYDRLMEGALWADWDTDSDVANAVALTDETVTIVAATRTITFTTATFVDQTAPVANKIVIGQFFSLSSGSATSIVDGNCGVYQVESVTSTTVAIVKAVDGATTFASDSVADTTDTCDVRASMLRAPRDGSDTYMKRHKYLFEKDQSDLGSTFLHYKECYVNNFSLSAQSAALLTGSFDFMGTESSMTSTTLGTTALTSASPFNGLNSVDHVYHAILDGKALHGGLDDTNTAYIQGFDFAVANNLRGAKAIGHLGAVDILAGQLGVTGNINIFFEGTTFYDYFIADKEMELSLCVMNENADGFPEGYVFTFPRMVLSSDSMSAGGLDQDLIENMAWTALFDDTSGTSIQIDRFRATYTLD